MPKQRISYVDPATLTDPAMLEELDRPPRGGATAGEFRDPCSRTRLFLVIRELLARRFQERRLRS